MGKINLFDSNPYNGHSFMNDLKKEFDKNMTPKEKAVKLVDKFTQYTPADEEFEYEYAKKCALIAVDEILIITSESYDIDHINWWQEVKQEIEKL